jgi:anti-sigma regulatory factor (Ser/Thr protein kinase)
VVADVLLALDEAVSNAIRHGSRAGDPVVVSVESDGEWVEMTVRDGGPSPRLPRLPAEPPPALQTGGRGLWLILQLVDEVRLQRIEDGTRLTMRRRVASGVESLVGRDGGG